MFSTEDGSAKTGIPVNDWRDASRKIGAHLKKHYPEVPPVAAQTPRRPVRVAAG